jgi:ribosomal protein S12 methylthiotransferase
MYLYPSTISEELLEIVAGNERIVPYLDIPLQHISTRILKGMNRRYSNDDVFELLDMIRKTLPKAALRTTFLLGFPGETVDDVEQIEEFLRIARFDHVGVFGYANRLLMMKRRRV